MFEDNTNNRLAKPPTINYRGEIIERTVYLTVKSDDGEAHGTIHVKSDVSMALLQQKFSAYIKNTGTGDIQ